jgi:hypothetical protein
VFLGPAPATILPERPAAEYAEDDHEQRDAECELLHGYTFASGPALTRPSPFVMTSR